ITHCGIAILVNPCIHTTIHKHLHFRDMPNEISAPAILIEQSDIMALMCIFTQRRGRLLRILRVCKLAQHIYKSTETGCYQENPNLHHSLYFTWSKWDTRLCPNARYLGMEEFCTVGKS